MHGPTVGWTHPRTLVWSYMDGGLGRTQVVREIAIATYKKYATCQHCMYLTSTYRTIDFFSTPDSIGTPSCNAFGIKLEIVELADTGNLPCIINGEIFHAVNCNYSHSFDASVGKKSFLELTSCTHVVAFVYVDPYVALTFCRKSVCSTFTSLRVRKVSTYNLDPSRFCNGWTR